MRLPIVEQGGAPGFAVEVRAVSKVFPTRGWKWPWAGRESALGKTALAGVDLVVQKGERLAIMGPNGSGKSTLLRIIATLITPTTGSVRVAGIPISDSRRVRAEIGWATGDERSFYWPLTGRANLEFFAALYKLHGRAAAVRIDHVLDMVQLASVADERFHAYSSGQRQRLAIARVLLSDPNILLLDEPTRSLDPDSAGAIRQVLGDLGAAGRTLLWVTHSPEEAAACCTRILRLDNGRIARSTED